MRYRFAVSGFAATVGASDNQNAPGMIQIDIVGYIIGDRVDQQWVPGLFDDQPVLCFI